MLKEARVRIADAPLVREPSYYGAMYARYLIDTESWDEADQWQVPDGVDIQIPHYFFARAFAAAKLGKLDDARRSMDRIRMGGHGNPEIMLAQEEVDILKLQIKAAIALAEGKSDEAVGAARRAADMQKGLPFRYGPPRISKPTSEYLGDVLFQLGDDDQAILAYQDELSRSQLRSNSLLGLARASARAGDDATSIEAYRSLAEVWQSADADVGGLAEARDQVSAP